ncbi:MAG: hypothetical protein V4658_03830 [Bacteroidota bacterium]
MKKLVVSAFVIASLASCHYGQDDAKKTLERNEEYKNENADFSVNRAGAYSYEGQEKKAADTMAVIVSDTAVAPAEAHH